MGVLKMYLHLWDQSGTQNGAYNSLAWRCARLAELAPRRRWRGREPRAGRDPGGHQARGESAIRALLVIRTRSIAAVTACIFERAQWRRALNGRPAPWLTKVANIITRTSHYERLTASSAGSTTQRGG